MIKNLFIDLDDTLWDTYHNNKESLRQVYTQLGWQTFAPDYDAFWDNYWIHNETLWALYRHDQIDKYTLILRRLREPMPWLNSLSDEEILDINRLFLANTATKTQLVDGACDVLEYLHRYYRVYILSNGFREVQSAKVERSGLLPYIHRMILSEDAGINKPNKAIFRYACSCTNSRVNESLMIGDSWAADIMGAKNIGMSSIWFNPSGLPLPEDPYRPGHIIARLEELRHIL